MMDSFSCDAAIFSLHAQLHLLEEPKFEKYRDVLEAVKDIECKLVLNGNQSSKSLHLGLYLRMWLFRASKCNCLIVRLHKEFLLELNVIGSVSFAEHKQISSVVHTVAAILFADSRDRNLPVRNLLKAVTFVILNLSTGGDSEVKQKSVKTLIQDFVGCCCLLRQHLASSAITPCKKGSDDDTVVIIYEALVVVEVAVAYMLSLDRQLLSWFVRSQWVLGMASAVGAMSDTKSRDSKQATNGSSGSGRAVSDYYVATVRSITDAILREDLNFHQTVERFLTLQAARAASAVADGDDEDFRDCTDTVAMKGGGGTQPRQGCDEGISYQGTDIINDIRQLPQMLSFSFRRDIVIDAIATVINERDSIPSYHLDVNLNHNRSGRGAGDAYDYDYDDVEDQGGGDLPRKGSKTPSATTSSNRTPSLAGTGSNSSGNRSIISKGRGTSASSSIASRMEWEFLHCALPLLPVSVCVRVIDATFMLSKSPRLRVFGLTCVAALVVAANNLPSSPLQAVTGGSTTDRSGGSEYREIYSPTSSVTQRHISESYSDGRPIDVLDNDADNADDGTGIECNDDGIYRTSNSFSRYGTTVSSSCPPPLDPAIEKSLRTVEAAITKYVSSLVRGFGKERATTTLDIDTSGGTASTGSGGRSESSRGTSLNISAVIKTVIKEGGSLLLDSGIISAILIEMSLAYRFIE
jgi:hypothetical protein